MSEGKTLAEIQHEHEFNLLTHRAGIAKEILALENHYQREKNELNTIVGLLGGIWNS